MSLFLVTAPAAEPLTAAELKLHLKIDSSTDDALITTLGIAAREYVESFTRRKLITQTWDLKGDDLYDELVLPFPPVSSVTSVTYVDANGTSQTLATSYYTTDLPTGPQASPGRLVRAYQQVWPSTREIPNAVVTRFVCGYGVAGTSVPSSLLAAIKLLVGHWYVNRESVVVGTIAQQVPQGVDALLWPYRVWL